MPQRHCCICSSSSILYEGAILHAFPNPRSDVDRFQTWVKNAGLVEEDMDYVYRSRRICRLHFEDIYHYPKNRLNKFAIPTLHLPGATNETFVEMQHINLEYPLLSNPDLVGTSISTENESSNMSIQIVMDNPQPSTSNNIAVSPNMDTLSPTKTNTIMRSIDRKSLSREEIVLYEKVAKMQKILHSYEKTIIGLKKKLKVANKLNHSAAYKIVTKHLPPAAKTFFAMQTKQAQKDPRGRRFTLDEKILALSLYKPSRKAYRILSQICVLPKKKHIK